MRRSTRSVLLALPVTLVVAAAGVFFAAQRTLSRSTELAQTGHQLAFTLRAVAPAFQSEAPPAFQPVAAPNLLHCGTFYADQLYLAGSGGLQIYTPDGRLRHTLRTGIELPVAPITSMATGQLRGASSPQLLLATAGAGLLLLEADAQGTPTLRQLEPQRAELRDLTAILPLPSGDLLLGTRHHGVLLYSGSILSPVAFHAEDGVDPARLQVTSLAAEDSASYLIGTRNQGLFYLHAGTVQHADRASGLPDEEIDALAVRGGKVYAGTPLGVAEFELADPLDGAAPFRPTRILAPGLFSHALAIDPSAPELIIGSLDQGIIPVRLDTRPRLRNASIAAPAEAAQTRGQRIDQFLTSPASQKQLYAISDGKLLMREATGWTPALPSSEVATMLTDRNISALAFNPDGRLYVGFFDRGLDVISPETNEPSRHLEDDHLFCVNRLMLDPERGTIAAATANGLVLFDRQGKPRQVLTRRDGLISDHVTDVAFTAHGTTLATAAGLTFLTPAGTESLYVFEGLVNNHVYALAAQHGSQRLFAGTLGGLSLLESSTVRRNYTASNSGLQHNWITAIASLPDGSELIGTYGAGIERLEIAKDGSASFTPAELPAAAPRDLIINPNALLVTATHVYAGTLGHGLLVYTAAQPGGSFAGGRWSLITRGLPSLNVTAFAERRGELFIGTENGLVRISEQALGSTLP